MGMYLEVPGEKLAWCKEHGLPKHLPTTQDYLPVCYLHNGMYDCVALGFNQTEIKRLKAGRPDGAWFLVPKAVLRGVTPGGEKMKELK